MHIININPFMCSQKKPCIRMFIAAVFIIAKDRNYLSTHQWFNG